MIVENIKDNLTNVSNISFPQQPLSGNAGNIKTNEPVDDITNATIDKNNNPMQRLFFAFINNRLF